MKNWVTHFISLAFLLGCAADSTVSETEPQFTGYGSVSGKVVNALDGSAISGASVYISGWQGSTQTTTAADGTYTISDSVPDGTRTVIATASGYNNGQTSVSVTVGATTSDANIPLVSSAYGSSSYVIVLTWGATPADLDSMLLVPNGGPVTIMWNNKGDNDGTINAAPFAALDLDDTDSYGPETTKINLDGGGPGPYYDGTYTFYVKDFTNAQGSNPTQLHESGARVSLFYNGSLVKTYEVPTSSSDQNNYYWQVFSIDTDGNITDINTLSTSQPAGGQA